MRDYERVLKGTNLKFKAPTELHKSVRLPYLLTVAWEDGFDWKPLVKPRGDKSNFKADINDDLHFESSIYYIAGSVP